jgi:hypothetical protein
MPRQKNRLILYIRSQKADCAILSAILVACSLYTLAYLTPSSYSIVLTKYFGVEQDKTGLLLGAARDIRYDEHSVITPAFQTCERNENRRFNSTSPYSEDLRAGIAFPLLDYGLVFKPYLWISVFGNAAFGYSFYWAFWYFCFIAGYFLLFRCFKCTPLVALFGAIALFSTSYVQMWWTSFAATLSVLPWIFLVTQSALAALPKALLLYYVITSWIIAFPYPGLVVIHGALLGLLIISTDRPPRIKLQNILLLGLGSAAASLTALVYLWEWVIGLYSSGVAGRSLSGGMVQPASLISYIYPFFHYRNLEEAFIPPNVCEVSTMGSLMFICAIVFSGSGVCSQVSRFKWLAVFTAGLVIWMVFPIPSVFGKLLLLDKTFANRLAFAVGLPMYIIALCAISCYKSGITLNRVVASLAIVICCLLLKLYLFEAKPEHLLRELIILSMLAASAFCAYLLCGKYDIASTHRAGLLLGAFVLPSALYFLPFNPLQSSRNIFEAPSTEQTLRLAKIQKNDPRNWLVVNGYQGGILNGMGFNSVTHTLWNPRPEFFRQLVTDLSEDDFNRAFNHWGYIVVETDPHLKFPKVVDEVVIFVPIRYFEKSDSVDEPPHPQERTNPEQKLDNAPKPMKIHLDEMPAAA